MDTQLAKDVEAEPEDKGPPQTRRVASRDVPHVQYQQAAGSSDLASASVTDLEPAIEQAKREFDEAIGHPGKLRAAWDKLSTLVRQRGDQVDDATE